MRMGGSPCASIRNHVALVGPSCACCDGRRRDIVTGTPYNAEMSDAIYEDVIYNVNDEDVGRTDVAQAESVRRGTLYCDEGSRNGGRISLFW